MFQTKNKSCSDLKECESLYNVYMENTINYTLTVSWNESLLTPSA